MGPEAYAGFEGYAELVLRCVERVPRGRVTTYGAVASVVGELLGRGGPRLVAQVMAREGSAVCWWRVVRADGSLPDDLARRARPEYLAEGTPLRADGRVDVDRAHAVVDLGGE
ncbi:MGMT family protein [Nocardioides daphniae]|uniref:Cysteine methyltransferase n=1 Tax=Nocardioides daphniae TaxID=402297 RepID=A0A4P7UE57_9ACTN|nr:MGMT family protein [Nocardioides daphniae]QCC77811.1 cysteine methyltransferase [Nocardioides daphniae]GGD28095.1 hypothetical protein GCM10007231_29500 [Nocardioides daphniae]